MLEAIAPGDRKKAIENFFSEIQSTAKQFNVLVDGVIHEILGRYFGELDKVTAGERKLGPLVPFGKVFIPYFTDVS